MTPVLGDDTSDDLNGLLCVIKLSKNFLVGKSRHHSVRPSVVSQMVTIFDIMLGTVGRTDIAGANAEHGCVLLLIKLIIIVCHSTLF
jgi:hypothetical protein